LPYLRRQADGAADAAGASAVLQRARRIEVGDVLGELLVEIRRECGLHEGILPDLRGERSESVWPALAQDLQERTPDRIYDSVQDFLMVEEVVASEAAGSGSFQWQRARQSGQRRECGWQTPGKLE